MKIRAAGIRKCDEFERTRTRLQPLNTCSAANSWPISVLKTDTNSYKGQQTHARKLSSAKSHTHRAEARISSNFCLEITSKMLPCTAKVEIPPPKLINFSLKAFFSFNKHAQPLSCAPTSGNRLHGGHSEWKSANSPTPPSTFSDLKAFLGSKKKQNLDPLTPLTACLNRFSVPILSQVYRPRSPSPRNAGSPRDTLASWLNPLFTHKFDYEANALIRRFPFFQGRITGVIMMGSYSEASRSIFASEKGDWDSRCYNFPLNVKAP